MATSLLFILIITALLLLGSSSGTLALNASRATSSVWRGKGEVNMLLGVETNDERRNVDNLLANAKECSDWVRLVKYKARTGYASA